MKKIKQSLSIVLAACTLFLSACGCGGSSALGGKKEGESLSVDLCKDYDRGIHELNYTQTNEYLVKNNATEYSILIPATQSAEIDYAVEELRTLFLEATKSNLAVIKDDEVGAYDANKKYISLGATTYAQAANVKPTKELDEYGYIIKTVGKSIYINANSDIGVTFGMYGFLELQFNFDCFSKTYYAIDKQNDAPLLNFDVRDVPDMKWRCNSSQYHGGQALRRMKLLERAETFAGMTSVHTTLNVLPFDTYGAEHSEWYGANGTQLCYTAHGDAEELELMISTVTDYAISTYQTSSSSQLVFSFGHEDTQTWCQCDTCAASNQKYGSNCPVQTKFINEVAKRVETWMETEEGKPYAKDFHISYLIYRGSINAPTVYDEKKGAYVPIDDTVIPAEHTMPIFAPLEMDFQCDIYDECNKKTLENYEAWRPIFENAVCGLFTYFQNYTSYWLYYDHYTNIQNWYKYIADFNVKWFYEEPQFHNSDGGGSAWAALRGYLCAKLSWNVNLDVDELTQRFFKYYFEDAADEMYDTFIATRVVASRIRPYLCDKGSNTGRGKFQTISLKKYWPEDLAVNSLAKIEKGLSEIAYLKKTDPVKYEKIYKNITSERLSYEYILIEFYAGKYDPDYIYELKLQAKKDAEDNILYFFGTRPSTTAQDVWDRWGI